MNTIRVLGRLVTSRVGLASALFSGVFVSLSWILEHDILYDLVNGMIVTMGLYVVAIYGPAAIEAAGRECPDRAERLIMGVVIGFSSTVMIVIYRFVWVIAGKPDNWIRAELFTFLLSIMLMSAAMHITAPDAEGRHVPKVVWNRMLAVIIVGAVLGLVIYAVETRFIP